METMLSSENFPSVTPSQQEDLETSLQSVLKSDYKGSLFSMLASYQRVLADNSLRDYWPEINQKLQTLFKCGKATPIDGPMIGVTVAIRDSDFFRGVAETFGQDRSFQASLEIMATAWNATLADTGLWMGKTFEPVSKNVAGDMSNNDPDVLDNYNQDTSRIGRNFFREPPDVNAIQSISLPLLEQAWHLKDRPNSVTAQGFSGELLENNLQKEKAIPYTKTGGFYLSNMGESVLPELNGKQVYQLNYRWPNLGPVFPMTVLVDEIVQLGEGVYLGQLVYATKRFSVGAIDLPFIKGTRDIELGYTYQPNKLTFFEWLISLFTGKRKHKKPDYGYQNNGYFLMLDPAYASQIYADDAFPQLKPRQGESGYKELGFDKSDIEEQQSDVSDWVNGWKNDEKIRFKFVRLVTEASTRSDDMNVSELLHEDESVLQMLQRISHDVSSQTKHEDHLKHFEKLHCLFRSGVAPVIKNGVFQRASARGNNVQFNGKEMRDWYGELESTEELDYYHGANLNLHWGFSETFCPDRESEIDDGSVMPVALGSLFDQGEIRGPNVMNIVWHSIGKYIFPWAGKTFEKISPRKLSMMLDESDDLKSRYPERVGELKYHLASYPHYALVKKNRDHYWSGSSEYTEHLKTGSWDHGMSDDDRAFWENEANDHWVMGYNIMDKRIVAAEALMRTIDINYREPEPALIDLSKKSGSPFVRQGYAFLGAADRQSILPMNNGDNGKKRVFQFHYRFPMIGGPVPIGFCLDEIVEIADGLFLGQLIYSTQLDVAFHSSVDPDDYKYQLFGYFLLLDDDWEKHRQAIKLDTL